MLARIGHELYWLGRYVSRAEHTTRMLEGVFAADLQGRPDDPVGVNLSWGPVMAIMGAEWDGAPVAAADALGRLVLDARQDASVVACVRRAREAARTLRDVVPQDMWEAINTLSLELLAVTPDALASDPSVAFRAVRERCTLFWGLVGRTMLRDEASAFLAAGERLEGADVLLRMLRVVLPAGPRADGAADAGESDGQAHALLRAVGGEQAFRRAAAGPPDTPHVARFLLFERDYPNAVAAHVHGVLRALEQADVAARSSPPVLRLSRLLADLDFHRRSLAGADRNVLVEQGVVVQGELAAVDRDISERYFAGALRPTAFSVA
ncbi:alpha-E domain-containing protein [Patulibacter sp. SYSU D01012]|uniref:alpha-E domain-containing protein n=1 Tax=Patulibacter sp. SYSU D01012 TaxID=2817381 RepID=UPI001B30D787|nr:alpha-E domain-containing protein [Patulibacter sp. SYSU D01012]